jgi:excisionase family DNA binding protein
MDYQHGYSIEGACAQLGDCSRAHIYRLVNQKKLELVKVGSRSIITGRSIRTLLEGEQSPATEAA